MQRERLTPERIRRFTCPEGTKQAFLWDETAPRLAVRATAGAKSFVFEAKLDRRTIRVTIGDVRAWNLDDARTEARRLQERQSASRRHSSWIVTFVVLAIARLMLMQLARKEGNR